MHEGDVIGLEGDYAVLCVTWYFSRLHLHAINAVNVPSKHRAMCLGLSMFWFTSIWGINQIPKRNLIMESIGNVFLGKSCISHLKLNLKFLCYLFYSSSK